MRTLCLNTKIKTIIFSLSISIEVKRIDLYKDTTHHTCPLGPLVPLHLAFTAPIPAPSTLPGSSRWTGRATAPRGLSTRGSPRSLCRSRSPWRHWTSSAPTPPTPEGQSNSTLSSFRCISETIYTSYK